MLWHQDEIGKINHFDGKDKFGFLLKCLQAFYSQVMISMIFSCFTRISLGFHDPIWRAYVSNGLKQPTRSQRFGAKNRGGTDPRETIHLQTSLPWSKIVHDGCENGSCQSGSQHRRLSVGIVLYLLVIYVELVKLIWGWECLITCLVS